MARRNIIFCVWMCMFVLTDRLALYKNGHSLCVIEITSNNIVAYTYNGSHIAYAAMTS